jgi:type III secretion protein L
MSASAIIKRTPDTDHGTTLSGVVKRPIIDARAEARRIIAQAEAEAALIRQSAEGYAREMREAAYREGYEAALEQLNLFLLDARAARDEALARAERDLLQLAIKIAEKIIGHQIERDTGTLADIVATALRNARRSELLTIRVNPADLPTIQEHRERLDPSGRARFLDIIPDPRVSSGGCIIESETGTINALLETQLRVLERALLARSSKESL